MDIDMIRNEIKKQIIEVLRDTDLDMCCSESILNELCDLDNLSKVDEFEISDTVFGEWHRYVDKIEKFLERIE